MDKKQLLRTKLFWIDRTAKCKLKLNLSLLPLCKNWKQKNVQHTHSANLSKVYLTNSVTEQQYPY